MSMHTKKSAAENKTNKKVTLKLHLLETLHGCFGAAGGASASVLGRNLFFFLSSTGTHDNKQ